MAVIQKTGNFMGLPMNVARGNPIPLDKSEIWYSYEAMANYAKTDVVAYVGQILGLVDETNKTAKAYIILNTDGDLQEVGAAVVVDGSSIVLNSDSALALKDWGKRYYKYVAAVGEEGAEDYVEAHYAEQIVDEEHPWIIGLEPKVASENGKLVLAWYQPNPTTIEGVTSQIAAIQTSVTNLQTTVGGMQDDIADRYTKEEADKKIADAIAAADHLQYKIVDSADDIDPEAENADNYIYLVKNGDSYDEYMVVEGSVEKVGNWAVDLSEYAKTSAVEEALKGKVNAEEGKRLVSEEEIAEWNKGEENYIKSVTEDFEVSAEGQLSLKDISQSKVTGLTEALESFVQKEAGKVLSSNDFTDDEKQKLADLNLQAITNNTNNISSLTTKVGSIEAAVNALDDQFVSHPELNTIVGDMSALIAASGKQETTLVAEIMELQDRLTWGELDESV